MAGLELRNISKRFGEHTVIDDVSLTLPEGELLVLLGPSGCGKTTLLRIIAGLEEADGGQVYIGDIRVDKLRPRDRNVALVFQNYSLYPHMTVEGNLAFPLQVAHWEKERICERVRQTAELLGVADRLKDRPAQLSGGQRQRVALGRAIVREPAIFLLDEPLSNLDAELRVRMRQEIVQLQRRLGKTMVHVTHDQTEALTMADRIALLRDGRIEQLGSPEELYQCPASRFVAEFIGTPRINMLPICLTDNRWEPFGMVLPAEISRRATTDGAIVVGLRPEAIVLNDTGRLAATVADSEYLGDRYLITLECGGLTLVASQAAAAPPPHSAVHLGFDEKALLYFDAATGARIPVDD